MNLIHNRPHAGGDAAEGVARLDAEAVNSASQRDLYQKRQQIYPKLVHGKFRLAKWVFLVLALGVYYLLPFVRWDRGPDAPQPGGADRFSQHALLFLLHRDMAPGSLLHHGPLDPRGAGSVSGDGVVWPGLVRLCLPADGVDRFVHRRGAIVRGRPQQAYPPRPRADEFQQGLAQGRQAHGLGADRGSHGRGLDPVFPRCVRPPARLLHRPGAADGLRVLRCPDLHHLFAGRAHARAGVHLYVPLAAHPGRAHRPGIAQRHLPHRPGRAARAPQEGRELGWAGRLHRLQGLRRRLPHGDRYPRRRAA